MGAFHIDLDFLQQMHEECGATITFKLPSDIPELPGHLRGAEVTPQTLIQLTHSAISLFGGISHEAPSIPRIVSVIRMDSKRRRKLYPFPDAAENRRLLAYNKLIAIHDAVIV